VFALVVLDLRTFFSAMPRDWWGGMPPK